MTALIALHLAATCYMTGVIWTVQAVHYPMMGEVGQTFEECQKFHQSRMGLVVGPAMLIELSSAAILCWLLPGELVWWVGGALLAGIWLSTFLLQVPKHNRLARGFDSAIHGDLVRTNWVRTVLWIVRAVLAVHASIK